MVQNLSLLAISKFELAELPNLAQLLGSLIEGMIMPGIVNLLVSFRGSCLGTSVKSKVKTGLRLTMHSELEVKVCR